MFVAFFDVFSPKPNTQIFCMHVNRSVTKSFIFEWQCVENGSSSTIIRTSNIERRICTQYIITLISSFSNTAKTKVCWLTEPINYVNKNPHKNNNNNNTTTVSEYKWREMKKEKKNANRQPFWQSCPTTEKLPVTKYCVLRNLCTCQRSIWTGYCFEMIIFLLRSVHYTALHCRHSTNTWHPNHGNSQRQQQQQQQNENKEKEQKTTEN